MAGVDVGVTGNQGDSTTKLTNIQQTGTSTGTAGDVNSTSSTNTSSNTNTSTQGASSTTGESNNQSFSNNQNQSQTVSGTATANQSVANSVISGSSTNANTGTSTSSNTGTSAGTNTSSTQNNQTSTTTGTVDAATLAQERAAAAQAGANATNSAATQSVVDNIFTQARNAFSGTVAQQTSSGLYGSSTLQNLQSKAEGDATASAASAVLNYQTQQQQLQSSILDSILQATKGSTTTTAGGQTTTGTSQTATGGTSTGTSAGTSTGTSQQITNAVNNATGTSNNTTNVNSSGQSSTDNFSQSTNHTDTSGNTQTGTNSNSATASAISSILNQISNQQVFGTSTTQVNSSSTQEKAGFSLSVVCTVLLRQSKISKELWKIGMKDMNAHSSLCVAAYIMWATPLAQFISANPFDATALKIGNVFIARLNWLKNGKKVADRGFAINILFAILCSIFGYGYIVPRTLLSKILHTTVKKDKEYV